MHWNDWLTILRWRAIEEGDTEGLLLTEERRRDATGRTCAGLTSDMIQSERIGDREEAFLLRRSRKLEQEVIGWSGSLVRVMERLTAVQGRTAWMLAGWIAALLLGYTVSGLDQETEFNLLALPLVGVLAWNVVIMVAALFLELKSANRSPMIEWLALRLSPSPADRSGEGDVPTGMTVDQRFSQLADAPAAERWQRRFRAWLHIAAAMLALGSIIGLYAHGWSKEYRAVWESTLLSDSQAQAFFGTLFKPASSVLRLPLPLEKLTDMQRTLGQAASSAPALPWIHLYAGTLLLLVITPRLLLALLSVWRAHVVMIKRMRSLGWQTYLIRTLRSVEGGQEVITVLIHATDATPTHREVWTRGVRDRFGRMIETEMIHVPLGDEDDFVADWKPAHPRVFIVFNLATTPELEVQRRFVLDVKQALSSRQRDAELIVLLDATSIGNRWSPDKMAGREKLWTEMLQGAQQEIIIAARRAGT
ncbi:MAG: DUF2868 domain-containing protein [Verrucomicrobia bacterium]|nr:DUF2868 domain-containing protein [Verrucomicrobiota bacterium]